MKNGEGVVTALSGGPDSTALLYVLNALKEHLGIRLYAVHLNHQIRGAQAYGDALFCKQTARKLNIPIMIETADVPRMAERRGLGLEEAGRKARLTVYKKSLIRFNARWIATGHTADDQAETVLMRVIQGTGLQGLSGIRKVYNDFIIRPLLNVKKEELLKYLEGNNVPYRVDPSNRDQGFLRNRVRHTLMPLIEREFNSNAVFALKRLAENCARADDYFHSKMMENLERCRTKTGAGVELDAGILAGMHPFMASCVLREAIKETGGGLKNVTFERTKEALSLLGKKTGTVVEIPGGVIVEKEYDKILIYPNEASEKKEKPGAVEIQMPGEFFLKQWGIVIRGEILKEAPLVLDEGKNVLFIDADRAEPGAFTVRPRRAGDRFRPLNGPGEKKLKDFFIDEKIPGRERDWAPLLEKNGTIAWIVGVRQSDEFKVTPDTEKIMKITVERI